MHFTSLPEAYAPFGAALRYSLTNPSGSNLQIAVRRDDGTLLGTKQFLAATSCDIDIAPMLRHSLEMTPLAFDSGFYSGARRCLTVEVEASNDEETILSERRTFTATTEPIQRPSLLTTLPTKRLITPDGYDELTFVAEEPLEAIVTSSAGYHTAIESFASSTGGMQLFCLHASDFPRAERIVVEVGSIATIEYTVVPAIEGMQHVAWRSSAGSIEHYTFPTTERVNLETTKRYHRSPTARHAHCTSIEERMQLCSNYETPAMMRALGEVLTSEQVWLLRGEEYEAVDVVTPAAELHRHGTLRRLSIEIRSTRNNGTLWN